MSKLKFLLLVIMCLFQYRVLAEEDATVYLNDEVGPETIVVELEADTLSPYVQAQVLVKLRLYRDASSFDAAMSSPKLSSPLIDNQVMLRSQEINRRQFRKIRNHRLYDVTERQYVLYPEASGKLRVGPAVFKGHIAKGGTTSFIEVESNILELDVRPIPYIFSGNVWIPARSVEIYQDFQPKDETIKIGTPISRNLFLSVTGLGSGHLPSFFSPKTTGFRNYPGQTQRKEVEHAKSGLIAVLQQEITLVPTIDGTFEISAIEVPWWNTIKDKPELATFPGRTVTVIPAKDNAQINKKGGGEQTSKIDINDGTLNGELLLQQRVTIVLLAIACFLFIFIFLFIFRKFNQDKISGKTNSELFRQALKACNNNDAKNAEKSVLQFFNQTMSDEEALSIAELACKVDSNLRYELENLNMQLYDSNEIMWDGRAMAKTLKEWKKQNYRRGYNTPNDKLPSLYPLAEGE